jgi:hypothetical protein
MKNLHQTLQSYLVQNLAGAKYLVVLWYSPVLLCEGLIFCFVMPFMTEEDSHWAEVWS